MIRVIPSISVSKGRLAKLDASGNVGERNYDRNPLDLAKYFEANGAEWLHVADLDGALADEVRNHYLLETITAHTGLKVNFSGGIRTDESLSKALTAGAKTVTVATIAATDPKRLHDWIITFGWNRLILGVDVDKDRKVVTRGWQTPTTLDVWELIAHFRDRGILWVKLTDVSRDGTMVGPNFDLYREARERFPDVNIVASGGVRNVADIEQLNEMGVWGVIIARAFYEGKLLMEDLRPYMASASV